MILPRLASAAGGSEWAAERRRHLIEGGLGLRSVGAAGLRHVGPAAAALAAERGGPAPHQLDGVEPAGQIGGDPDHRSAVTPTMVMMPEPS